MEKKDAENEFLQELMELEDLAEKKAKIYARLLIDPALAGKMEELSLRHAKRKERLCALLYGENKTQKKGAGTK